MFKVSLKEFEAFIREGVEAIPDKFRSRIVNVAFLADEEPTEAQRKENKLHSGETLFGLYEGIPHPARGEGYGGMVLPDRITIFKKPIEMEATLFVKEQLGIRMRPHTNAKQKEMFKREVKKHVIDTVWHEIAHHFGLNEYEVERREQERGTE